MDIGGFRRYAYLLLGRLRSRRVSIAKLELWILKPPKPTLS